MKRRMYTHSELAVLKVNSNIVEVKNKRSIIYTNNFKLWAVMYKLEYPEITCKEIFQKAGFDLKTIDERIPDKRINDWSKKYKQFGIRYFQAEHNLYFTLEGMDYCGKR